MIPGALKSEPEHVPTPNGDSRDSRAGGSGGPEIPGPALRADSHLSSSACTRTAYSSEIKDHRDSSVRRSRCRPGYARRPRRFRVPRSIDKSINRPWSNRIPQTETRTQWPWTMDHGRVLRWVAARGSREKNMIHEVDCAAMPRIDAGPILRFGARRDADVHVHMTGDVLYDVAGPLSGRTSPSSTSSPQLSVSPPPAPPAVSGIRAGLTARSRRVGTEPPGRPHISHKGQKLPSTPTLTKEACSSPDSLSKEKRPAPSMLSGRV